jgi:hypothetical protein
VWIRHRLSVRCWSWAGAEYSTACRILRNVGLTDKFFIENRRIRYELEEVVLDPAEKTVFSATQIYVLQGIRYKDYSRITFDEMAKK